MRNDFTAREVADYCENGFLAVDDFLNPSELANWRSVIGEVIDSDLARQPEGSGAAVFTQRMKLRRVRAARSGRRPPAWSARGSARETPIPPDTVIDRWNGESVRVGVIDDVQVRLNLDSRHSRCESSR